MPFHLNRRRLLQTSIAAGALYALGDTSAYASSGASARWVLLGTQTGGSIFRAQWDGVRGTLSSPELAVETPQPTYLALHPTLPVVYAGNELDVPSASVSAFTFDPAHATLRPLGKQPTHGSSPCFVSVDRTGRLLFTANYGGGSLSAFAVDAAGVPSPAVNVYACREHGGACGTTGPVHDRQDGPHLHCAVLSPDQRFVLACDLGDDSILAFPLTPGEAEGAVTIGSPQRLPARLGSGPRHLAFHPSGRWLYCIHELDCTVDMYTWRTTRDVAEAQLVPQVLAQLAPAGPAAHPNTGCEIAISRDGRFLYTCTRGVDILSIHSVNASTGQLTLVQQLPCGGQTPRFFALDPTERWLVCTNQEGNNVTVFAREAGTGRLTAHGSTTMSSPMCVVWL